MRLAFAGLFASVLSIGSCPFRILEAQQPDTLRVILRTGARCYVDADRTKPYGGSHYYIGDTVWAVRSKHGPNERAWYADGWRGASCWVDGAETIPLDKVHPELTAARIADSLLARRPTFEQALELLSKFEWRLSGSDTRPAFVRYPILAFKRLQLIDRLASMTDGHKARDTPHVYAFIVAHQDLLQYYDPSADWRVPGAPFLKLVDANLTEPWADDAAWVGATQPQGGDECPSSCWIAMIGRGIGEYWKRFPGGRHARESFAQADSMTRNATSIAADEPPTHKEVAALRALVPASSLPERARLLEAIAALDRVAR